VRPWFEIRLETKMPIAARADFGAPEASEEAVREGDGPISGIQAAMINEELPCSLGTGSPRQDVNRPRYASVRGSIAVTLRTKRYYRLTSWSRESSPGDLAFCETAFLLKLTQALRVWLELRGWHLRPRGGSRTRPHAAPRRGTPRVDLGRGPQLVRTARSGLPISMPARAGRGRLPGCAA